MKQIETYLETNPEIRPAIVSYALINDKVLLGVRKKSSTDLGVNIVAGIGGKLETDESHEQALIREVKEEIGITPITCKRMGKVVFLYPHKPKWNLDVEIYIIEKWDGDPVESDEIKPQWLPIRDLPFERMFIDNKYWVPHILAGKTVKAIFLYSEGHNIAEYKVEIFDKI